MKKEKKKVFFFFSLYRKLIGDANLEFVAMPAFVPPEITMDPKWQEKIENDMKVGFVHSSVYLFIHCVLPLIH